MNKIYGTRIFSELGNKKLLKGFELMYKGYGFKNHKKSYGISSHKNLFKRGQE